MTWFKHKKKPEPTPEAAIPPRVQEFLTEFDRLRSEIHDTELRLEKDIKQLVNTLKPEVEYPTVTFTWRCTDLTNPVGFCVYDDEQDPANDECLFCGDPEERK